MLILVTSLDVDCISTQLFPKCVFVMTEKINGTQIFFRITPLFVQDGFMPDAE